MRTQPVERASIMPTQVQPVMPSAERTKKVPKPKQKPTRAQAVTVAKARIMRRKSLLAQRQALKG
jgi:hypothetical protein